MFMKGQLYNVTSGKLWIKLALGFLACSLIPQSSIPLKLAIGAFALGQTIFIAPLYYTAVTDKKHGFLTKMMPAGGASLLVGWTSLLLAAWYFCNLCQISMKILCSFVTLVTFVHIYKNGFFGLREKVQNINSKSILISFSLKKNALRVKKLSIRDNRRHRDRSRSIFPHQERPIPDKSILLDM